MSDQLVAAPEDEANYTLSAFPACVTKKLQNLAPISAVIFIIMVPVASVSFLRRCG